jgi:hypothetical protein
MACGEGVEKNIDNKQWQDLSSWDGLTLEELLVKLREHVGSEIRIYTVASTSLDNVSNDVRHRGSGPNLEGGLATLCTCKHSMRQNHIPEEWKGCWILGLTSRAKNKGFNGKHYLLYMMKIEQAFESHKELYEYLMARNRGALANKNAAKNRLGDIFEPRSNCIDPKNQGCYKRPHPSHSHGTDGDTQWHTDIEVTPLLLGEIGNTFVWPHPMIEFRRQRGVGNMKLKVGEDLFDLFRSPE